MLVGLRQNEDGSYDIVVEFTRDEPEFAREFFDKKTEQSETILEFARRQAGKVKINAVKILVSGVLLATIPFTSLLASEAAAERAAAGKYSMAYLYLGSDKEQIGYVQGTQNSLNTVTPSWFDINADGTLNAKYVSPRLMSAMRAEGIKVVPFLSNHWNREAGIQFLQDPERWSTVLADHVRDSGLDGLNIDIENVTHNERDKYTQFVRLLRQKVPAGKEISVAVAANPNGWTQGWHGSYDYAALGQYADHLFIMTYDQSYQGGPAGPVASFDWVESSIRYALKHVPAQKIVLGLPFFGRLWSDTGFNGQGVYLNLGNTLTTAYNAAVTYDGASHSPKAEFTVRSGDPALTVLGKKLTPGRYTLWMENKASLEKKLTLVTKYGLKGAGSWALGQDTADIWQDYTAVLNNQSKPTPPTTGPSTSGTTKPETSKPGGSSGGGTTARPGGSAAGGSSSAGTSPTQPGSPAAVAPEDGDGGEAAPEVLPPADEEADIPGNLVDQEQAGEGGAAVYDKPGGSVVGWLTAGTLVLVLGISAAGYYRIRWNRKNRYVRREDFPSGDGT